MKPMVSIIIPVYNGDKYIKKCLDSLSRQTLPVSQYEIIIVDNGSTDKSIQVAENYRTRIVKEPKRGSYAARNKGIKIARGELIGFTDVDCLAADDWLEQAVKCDQDNENLDIIAGKVDFISDQPLNVWGYFDQNTFLNQEYAIKTGSAKTANMFVKRSLFNKVGLFDDNLFSGGDVHWTAKAVEKGAEIYYHPEAVVYHPVRNNFREIGSKCFRVGYGKGQLLGKGKEGWSDSTININHLKHPFSLLGSGLAHKKEKRSMFFLVRMMAAVFILSLIFLAGMIRGYLRF